MCNQVPKCGMTAYVQDGKIVRVESRTPIPPRPFAPRAWQASRSFTTQAPADAAAPHELPRAPGSPNGTHHLGRGYDTIVSEFNRVKDADGRMP